jgi:hypothetical protein
MAIVDFILNGICLLLWLNWQSRRLSPFGRTSGIALVSTLKRAEPARGGHWYSLAALPVLLLARAMAYVQFSSAFPWTPRLSLGAIVLHFRSDMFSRMLLFSVLGFLLFLLTFYCSLFLIAAANRKVPVNDLWQSAVRAHLGLVARWPAWVLLLLPFVITFVLWLAVGPLLARLGILVSPATARLTLAEAVVIAAGAWMLFQYVLIVVLALHALVTYVYLGNAAFWNFITLTAQNFLRPLQWLPTRIGRIDLLPFLVIAAVILVGRMVPLWLAEIYSKLQHWK